MKMIKQITVCLILVTTAFSVSCNENDIKDNSEELPCVESDVDAYITTANQTILRVFRYISVQRTICRHTRSRLMKTLNTSKLMALVLLSQVLRVII